MNRGTTKRVSDIVRYDQLFDSIRDAILVANTKREIIDCNDALTTLFGYSLDEIRGKQTHYVYKSIEEYKEMGKKLAKHIDDPQFLFNIRYKKKDGEIFVGETNAFYLRNKDDEIVGFIGLIRDISERLKTEKKKEEALERARFFRDLLSHDINNILTSIKGSIDLIKEFKNQREKSGKIDSFFKVIDKQLIKGERLIFNTVLYSRFEEKEEAQILESINIQEYIEKAIQYIKTLETDEEIRIKKEILDKRMCVKANDLLLDAFENILLNSVTHNEEPIKKICVKIVEINEQSNNRIQIEFEDNGVGIPDEKKETIFQGNFSKERQTNGLGIGLSLVKQIINSYNGQIWVENRIKEDFTQGSRFIIVLEKAD